MGSKRQNSQLELAFGEVVRSEAPNRLARGTEDPVARPTVEGSAALPGVTGGLMEAIVAHDNLKKALAQVKRNKGAPGVDGMTVEELTPYLKERRRSAPSCSTAPTGRSRCGGSRSRSPPGARVPSASQACPGEGRGCSTALSSRRCCRCRGASGTRRSVRAATAFGRAARRIRRWLARNATLPRGAVGWWTSHGGGGGVEP
jgi:hypothetical protein